MPEWSDPTDGSEEADWAVPPAGRTRPPAGTDPPDAEHPDLNHYPDGLSDSSRQPEPADRPPPPTTSWLDEPLDLGSFEAAPGRTSRLGKPDDSRLGGTGGDRIGGTGRHRRQSRLRGPVGLGVAVAALLGLFGIGAALLPPSLTGTPGEAPPDQQVVGAADGSAGSAAPQPTEVDAETAVPAPAASPPRSRPRPTATTAAPRTNRTTSAPARRATARPPSAGDSREAQVLAIVNRERADNGCGSVVINNDLAEAARLHSQDQGEHTNMSHTGSDGSSFVDRARRAGYDNPIGENVAMGYETPAAVMDGWMNSAGHRANILNCDAKAMGVGVATGADGRLYWTQVFGATA